LLAALRPVPRRRLLYRRILPRPGVLGFLGGPPRPPLGAGAAPRPVLRAVPVAVPLGRRALVRPAVPRGPGGGVVPLLAAAVLRRLPVVGGAVPRPVLPDLLRCLLLRGGRHLLRRRNGVVLPALGAVPVPAVLAGGRAGRAAALPTVLRGGVRRPLAAGGLVRQRRGAVALRGVRRLPGAAGRIAGQGGCAVPGDLRRGRQPRAAGERAELVDQGDAALGQPLLHGSGDRPGDRRQPGDGERLLVAEQQVEGALAEGPLGGVGHRLRAVLGEHGLPGGPGRGQAVPEIGRASWRERGEGWAAAGALKRAAGPRV